MVSFTTLSTEKSQNHNAGHIVPKQLSIRLLSSKELFAYNLFSILIIHGSIQTCFECSLVAYLELVCSYRQESPQCGNFHMRPLRRRRGGGGDYQSEDSDTQTLPTLLWHLQNTIFGLMVVYKIWILYTLVLMQLCKYDCGLCRTGKYIQSIVVKWPKIFSHVSHWQQFIHIPEWYLNLTAHQHQKGHTVPKHV